MAYDHTELRKQFNEEYAGNDRAIENWQMRDRCGKWFSYNDIKGHKPVFYSDTQYRRNPEAPPAAKPHVHAANMLLYAQESQISNCTWKNWQVYHGNSWVECNQQPSWCITNMYRRKPMEFVPTKEDQLYYLDLVRFCLRNEGELYRCLFSSLSQQSKDYFTNNTKNPYVLFPNVFKAVK